MQHTTRLEDEQIEGEGVADIDQEIQTILVGDIVEKFPFEIDTFKLRK